MPNEPKTPIETGYSKHFLPRFSLSYIYHLDVTTVMYRNIFSQIANNSTEELEVRVTILETEVANLEDAVEDVEIDINQQNDRIDNVEDEVNTNTDNIIGRLPLFRTKYVL